MLLWKNLLDFVLQFAEIVKERQKIRGIRTGAKETIFPITDVMNYSDTIHGTEVKRVNTVITLKIMKHLEDK